MKTFLYVAQTIFGGAWQLFQLQIPIPGLNLTFAHVVLAVGFGSVAIALVHKMAGNSGSSSNGRNSRNPKISEERKNDTK